MSRSSPNLEGLGILGQLGLRKLLSPSALREYGLIAAGGAGGLMATRALEPTLAGLPVIGAAPPWVRAAALGVIGAALLDRVNVDAAKGFAGAVLGSALDNLAQGLLSGAGLKGLGFTVVPGAPGAEELAATNVLVDPDQLAEIEPTQEFAGLDARIEEVAPLGAFIGA